MTDHRYIAGSALCCLVWLPGGEPGWIFGGLLKDYDPARRREIVEAVFQERLNVEQMSVDDGVDFHDSIARSGHGSGVGAWNARADACSRAVGPIPIDQHSHPPYRDFHRAERSGTSFTQ